MKERKIGEEENNRRKNDVELFLSLAPERIPRSEISLYVKHYKSHLV